jgi:hypothetical protein
MPHTLFKLFIFGMIAVAVSTLSGCQKKTATPPPPQSSVMSSAPKKILWAWERPEDLRFIDNKSYGVAFLAQTLHVRGSEVAIDARKQPLRVPPGTFLIAVTRIETDKDSQPVLGLEQKQKIVSAVLRTLKLDDVRAVQTDFDVAVSARKFRLKFRSQ